jgi:hypothetical protein
MNKKIQYMYRKSQRKLNFLYVILILIIINKEF